MSVHKKQPGLDVVVITDAVDLPADPYNMASSPPAALELEAMQCSCRDVTRVRANLVMLLVSEVCDTSLDGKTRLSYV